MFLDYIKKLIPQPMKNKIKTLLSILDSYDDTKAKIGKLTTQVTELSSQVTELSSQVTELVPRVKDCETLTRQTLTILSTEHQYVPPPPKHLQVRVVGGYVPDFLESGFTTCQTFNEILQKNIDKDISNFSIIYDFGCGCGRIMRALKSLYPACKLYGSDIDSEAITWLQQNYSKIGKFSVNSNAGRTIYPDNSFEFIYSISVFTHLPEDMQFFWLRELQRIVKPGGILLLTTHGEKHYQTFTPEIQSLMETKGFFYSAPGYNYGRSIGLPDFYQNAFHSHSYIHKEWGKYFNIIDIIKLGLDNHQDVVILEKQI